jgi:hypothetical protein
MPSAILQGVNSWGQVYCTSCTHKVNAEVTVQASQASRTIGWRAVSGQKCPRCSSSLDAAVVLTDSAARVAA